MKKVMSPEQWDLTLGKEGEYLIPRESPAEDRHYPPR